MSLFLVVLAAAGFASTVIHIPAPAPLPLGFERRTPLPLRAQVGRISQSINQLLGHSPKASIRPPQNGQSQRPLTVGFYATWSDESAPALAKNIGQLDWVVPTTLAVDSQGRLHVNEDRAMRRILSNSMNHPLVLPMVQNVVSDVFSSQATASLLQNSGKRSQFISGLESYVEKSGDSGLVFDFENIASPDIPLYRQLIAETNARFDHHGWIVGVTLPLGNSDWDISQFAAVADKLFLMAYDEHWQGGGAGPIASNGWFYDHVAAGIKGLPTGKAIIALGSYGYDWHNGHAESLTVEEAWLSAHDSGSVPQFMRGVGNTAFSLLDNNQRHDIWLLDAAASWNQMQMLSKLGVGDIALWRLGSEDPGFWPALAAWRNHGRPDLTRIAEENTVDVEGSGEILRITTTPKAGVRQVTFDPRSNSITGENYLSLPTPYVVQRTGANPKQVALTFDDGPDPKWTPQILAILESYHVPATFFIIGENGVSNRSILQRIVADGYELGNHSYTHPNMAHSSDTSINLELNATQRLAEAYTGRSLRLFRAPYFGDAEPTTADELNPAMIAQDHGYTVVGLHVDPGDWKKLGAKEIVDQTLAQVEGATEERSGNIVLLHDGGGDRSQTVAALPGIIIGLQRAGYEIVPVGKLAGLSYDKVMPKLAGGDLAAVRADVFAFTAIGASIIGLNWIFFFAIAMGVIRAIALAFFAVLPKKRQPPAISATFQPTVTVIIPAFNEERVIAASVQRILESSYPALHVLVVDDGSSDQTSAIMRHHYADNPRVQLLTLANGGKAAALNRALAMTTGEIIVALDADTQFERDTISLLVRWFANPKIGAVAGNAKVGNRINLVTRWQGIEYVTAQNIERKALTRFDAITVVPGAVGAWRRSALDDVGGYPENTLAEDQDLTFAIQRKKWKVAYDEDAVAWTEAPENFAALSKQRFRWSYGTLQCLWKHRKIMRRGKPGGLAFIGMPQAWLFQ
ncbi:MAG: hypothetical protein RLY97_1627, partial [Pseudomonadota bacterium]